MTNQKLKNKIRNKIKHKHQIHIEQLGNFADAFWIAHSYLRDTGKLIGLKPRENLLLKTEEYIERKTNEYSSYSAFGRDVAIAKRLKTKDDIGIFEGTTLKELKRRLKRFQ